MALQTHVPDQQIGDSVYRLRLTDEIIDRLELESGAQLERGRNAMRISAGSSPSRPGSTAISAEAAMASMASRTPSPPPYRSGLGELFARLAAGRHLIAGGRPMGDPFEAHWRMHDVRRVIELAMVGGDHREEGGEAYHVRESDAQLATTEFMGSRPLAEAWALAFAIVAARVVGVEGESTDKPSSSRRPRARRTKEAA